MFRRLRNADGVSDFNFRPLQPMNGRKLEFFHAGELIGQKDQGQKDRKKESTDKNSNGRIRLNWSVSAYSYLLAILYNLVFIKHY